MNVEQLNTTLRNKVMSELYVFESILLMQKPQMILDHAVEYATKKDMVAVIKETEFSEKEAKAMLNTAHLLDKLSKEYGSHSSNSMDVLVTFITDKADELASSGPGTRKDRGNAR